MPKCSGIYLGNIQKSIAKVSKSVSTRFLRHADDVSNEHIIHGGPVLLQRLKLLFDRMFQLEHVPGKFKIGIIIPIHKPSKCRESTESYRPITLVSTLYKLFESILHSRLQAWSLLHGKCFPSPQQNAYQKHMGSITASFNLQETIAHNIELGSNCYVAFLDAAKAFIPENPRTEKSTCTYHFFVYG